MPLHVVQAVARRLDWVCASCGTQQGQLGAAAVVISPGLAVGDTPAVSITCPVCGAIESFNTRLTAEDEDATAAGNSTSRADQARLVRALCRLAGLVVLG